MPTYEYICRGCGHEFEVFQSMKDGPKRKCPECGKNSLERKIGTGAAIIFKGSGFYQTDYRSESYKKSADADKKPAADVKSDSTSAAAAKPEKPKATDTGAATATEPKKSTTEPAPKRGAGKRTKS